MKNIDNELYNRYLTTINIDNILNNLQYQEIISMATDYKAIDSFLNDKYKMLYHWKNIKDKCYKLQDSDIRGNLYKIYLFDTYYFIISNFIFYDIKDTFILVLKLNPFSNKYEYDYMVFNKFIQNLLTEQSDLITHIQLPQLDKGIHFYEY